MFILIRIKILFTKNSLRRVMLRYANYITCYNYEVRNLHKILEGTFGTIRGTFYQ